MDNFEFAKAFALVWRQVQACNKQIDDQKPWELAKTGQTVELHAVLSSLVSQLLDISRLLEPFLPHAAARIAEIFSAKPIVPPATPLFPKA